MTISFRRYLAERRITNTPAGQFTQDAAYDPDMPKVNTWLELRQYLERRNVHREVIAAARSVWCSYIVALKRNAKLPQK